MRANVNLPPVHFRARGAMELGANIVVKTGGGRLGYLHKEM